MPCRPGRRCSESAKATDSGWGWATAWQSVRRVTPALAWAEASALALALASADAAALAPALAPADATALALALALTVGCGVGAGMRSVSLVRIVMLLALSSVISASVIPAARGWS